MDADAVKKQSILNWCKAWQSGEDEEELLKQAVSLNKGISRWVGGMMGQFEGAFHHWQGWMKVDWKSLPSVLQEIKEKKEKETIEATIIDLAICQDYNVGFSHWKGRVVPLGGGEVREMGGMSVYLFDADGRIEDVWTLKDPNPTEKAKMKEACSVLASKMSRIEWA